MDIGNGSNSMNHVTNNEAAHRFELAIEDSSEIAAAYYRVESGLFILTHTIVPQHYSGQGFGSHLARGLFDTLRATGRKAVLLCPFMAAYYARHPDYRDIVENPSEPRI